MLQHRGQLGGADDRARKLDGGDGAGVLLGGALLELECGRVVAREERARASGLHGRLEVGGQTGGELEGNVRQDGRLQVAQARYEVVTRRAPGDNFAGCLEGRMETGPVAGKVVVVVVAAVHRGRWRRITAGRRRVLVAVELTEVGQLVTGCAAGGHCW